MPLIACENFSPKWNHKDIRLDYENSRLRGSFYLVVDCFNCWRDEVQSSTRPEASFVRHVHGKRSLYGLQKLPLLQALRQRGRNVWCLQKMIAYSATAHSEIIAERLRQAGLDLECWTTFLTNKKMFIIDAQKRDRRRFIVCADEELAALLELERVANAVREV